MALHERVGQILDSNRFDLLTKNGMFHRWIPDWELNLTHVPNTIITCRVCRGTGIISSVNFGRNTVNTTVCPECKGTKIMHSQLSDLSWRGQ